VQFAPGTLTTHQAADELTLVAQDATAVAALKQGDVVSAKATLKDGRVLALSTLVAGPRPSVKLLGKSVELSSVGGDNNIQLSNQDELPQDARLTFSVRTVSPTAFAFDQKIEVATVDAAYSTTLTLNNGGVTLEDSKVAVATLDPAKAFGSSAFGPLQFRVIANGVPGDWQKLATLVRLPVFKDLKCPATAELACKLSGSNLFLVDSVSSDPKFAHPVQVPDGFPGYTMPVPHPRDGNLYVKLRDDPSVVNSTALGAQQLPATSDEAARAPERQAAHAEPEAAPTPAPAPNAGTKSTVLSSSDSTSALPAPVPPAAAAQPAEVTHESPVASSSAVAQPVASSSAVARPEVPASSPAAAQPTSATQATAVAQQPSS
jgi:hypothetical protein